MTEPTGPRPDAPNASRDGKIFAAFTAVGVAALAVFAVHVSRDPAPVPTAIVPAAEAPAQAERPQPRMSVADAMKGLNVAQALVLSRSDMADTVDELSPGAAAFAIWAAGDMRWSDAEPAKDETSVAKVMKDPDGERAKRLCVRGSVTQIRRDASVAKPLWVGNLLTSNYKIVNFLAAGSSGELVVDSRARLCGYVTGVYAFSNTVGGQTQAVQIVGMFDLPENVSSK